MQQELPHQSQLHQGYRNLCGQTVFAMIASYAMQQRITPKEVAINTKTADGRFRQINDIINFAREYYGLTLTLRKTPTATQAWYKSEIDAERVAIALVDYGELYPGEGHFGHFILVVGYTTNENDQIDRWLIHNPLKLQGPEYIPVARFEAAISDRYPNFAYQGIATPITVSYAGGGMNLDSLHPYGNPDPMVIAGVPFARMVFNVSRSSGSTDLNAAYALYSPYLQALKAQGTTPILVLNHQTWGEGQQYNWEQMNPQLWEQFATGFVNFLSNIIQTYRDKQYVYQIWNEQDTPEGQGRAAVPIPAADYGKLFNRVYQMIKSIDPGATVITGGHVTGASAAADYFVRSAIAAVDGIGCHPYGQGAASNPNYKPFGNIESYLALWRQRTQKPLWITEFGVLDQPNEPIGKVIDYAWDVVRVATPQVKAICWYAIDDMDNGFGARKQGVMKVDNQGRNLIQPFVQGAQPPEYGKSRKLMLIGASSINFRATPSTIPPKIGTLVSKTPIEPTGTTFDAEGYHWIEADALQNAVWIRGVFAEQAKDGSWYTGITFSAS